MSIYSTIKGAVLGSLLAIPSVVHAQIAADPNCWRADETEAAHFEGFRLKLLVGALNCKSYLPGTATSYNQFLAAKKDLVLANAYVLRLATNKANLCQVTSRSLSIHGAIGVWR